MRQWKYVSTYKYSEVTTYTNCLLMGTYLDGLQGDRPLPELIISVDF